MHSSSRSAFHFLCGYVAWILVALLAACGRWQPPLNASGTAGVAGAHTGRNPTSSYNLLYSLRSPDGKNPISSLTYVNGSFYSTTKRGGTGHGGTVFALDSQGKLSIIHSFRAGPTGYDGFFPLGGVTELNGTLYGTTSWGGTKQCNPKKRVCGVVYQISPSGSNFKVIHRFSGGSDGSYPYGNLLALNGKLYGTTVDKVFAITPSGKLTTVYTLKNQADGTQFNGGLVTLQGTLYGTTRFGGATCGCGIVFSLTASGVKRTLHSFQKARDGDYPEAGLTVLHGSLYGTTSAGGTRFYCGSGYGSNGCGTVFEVSTSGEYRVLYRFRGANDGASPQASLLVLDDTLYGTTFEGGPVSPSSCKFCGNGTIFRVTPTGSEVVLHTFQGAPNDGAGPAAALTNIKGTLYGTTGGGGRANQGAIFSITP